MRGCGRVDAGLRRGSGEGGPLVGLFTAFGERKRGFMRGPWARGSEVKAWKRRGRAAGWHCAAFGEKKRGLFAGCGRVEAGLRHGSGEAGPLVGFARAIGVGCWLRRGSGEAGPLVGFARRLERKSEASSRAVSAWKRG